MTQPIKRQPWSGRKVTSARTYWAARLAAAGPLPCALCGKPVSTTDRWVVEHLTERSRGGSDARSNQGISHRPCSDSSGGQMGAAITHARRPTTVVRLESNQARGIRGI